MFLHSLIRWFLLIALLAGLPVLAACGDDDEEAGNGATSPAATEEGGGIADGAGGIDISGVPELEDGVLNVGSDIAYAPMEFFQEGTETPDGFDVDLGNALAEELGVDAEFLNTGFDGLIPGLGTADYDVIMSAMTITEERSQEIDFIPYLNVGLGILVPTGNPDGIQGVEDLCGLTVAVQVGTIQEELANEQSALCDQPIEVVTFDTNPLAVEDLRTGGSDANMADFPVAALDAEESDGDLEVVSPQVDPEPYGIGVSKDATALRDVLEQALEAVRDSGEYDDLLTKWGLELAALE
jgi:polar amino acid transport system substrate-binding protein